MKDIDKFLNDRHHIVSETLLAIMNCETYYGSIVIGRYKVLMVDYKEFDNESCVYIYKVKENGGLFGKNNILTAKQFFDNANYKYSLERNKEYILMGFLESEVYKNKTTGEWINNGGIINITLGIPVNKEQEVKEW